MSITTVTVVVPSSGEGPASGIDQIVGQKTVQLSGSFSGYYDLLASQDDLHFVAVASFNAGGPEGIKIAVDGSYKSVKLRAQAIALTPISCVVSGTLGAGQNGFGTVASLSAGFSGLTAPVDLGTFVPPTGPETGSCLVCQGSFVGAIVVLGSLDGAEYNPVGEFRVDRRPEGAPSAVDLSPLLVDAKIRFARLLVNAIVTGPVVVTVGGRVPSGGGVTGSDTCIIVTPDRGNYYLTGAPAGSVPVTDILGNTVTTNNDEVVVCHGTDNVVVNDVAQAGPTLVVGIQNTTSGGLQTVVGVGNNLGPQAYVVSCFGSYNTMGATLAQSLVVGNSCAIADSTSQSTALGYNASVASNASFAVGTAVSVGGGGAVQGIVGEFVTHGEGGYIIYSYGSEISVGDHNSYVLACGAQLNVGSGTGEITLVAHQCSVGDDSQACAVFGRALQVLGTGDTVQLFGDSVVTQDASHLLAAGISITTGTGLSYSTLVGNNLSVGDSCDQDLVVGSYVTLADSAERNIVLSVNTSTDPVSVDGTWNIILRTRGSLTITDAVTCVIIGADAYAVNNSVAIGTGAMVLGIGNSNVALGDTAVLGAGTELSCALIDSDVGADGIDSFVAIVSHIGDTCGNCLSLVGSGVAFGGAGTTYSAALVASFVGSDSDHCLAMIGGGVPDHSFNCAAVGFQAATGTVASFALGSQASALSHQIVIGASADNCDVNDLTVNGLLADGTTAIVVLHAVASPAAGGLTGLSVTYNDGAAITSKTVKAATSPGPTALLLYLDP